MWVVETNQSKSHERFRDITNIDISEVVIDQMKEKHSDLPMRWEVMDATNMTFPDETFDLVIDKGTFDALSAPALPQRSAERLARRPFMTACFLPFAGWISYKEYK